MSGNEVMLDVLLFRIQLFKSFFMRLRKISKIFSYKNLQDFQVSVCSKDFEAVLVVHSHIVLCLRSFED